MATATVTITTLPSDPDVVVVDISETAVAAGTSVVIGDDATEAPYIPKIGRILRVESVLVSGGGATVAPVLSGSTSFTDHTVAYAAFPAAIVDEMPDPATAYGGWPYCSPTGILYHRATPDTASNNVVKTRYFLKKGL